MAHRKIPQNGDAVPMDKFHISTLNVRKDEGFGETDDDRQLVEHMKGKKKIIEPLLARPEGSGFGIFVGRRRFLAMKEAGVKKTLVIGRDVILEDVDPAESREDSLIENLDLLKKELDPLIRAREFDKLIRKGSLRDTAKRLGISVASLSEWVKVLELSQGMQKALSEGRIFYTDALAMARMQIPQEQQEKLAKVLSSDGMPAFQAELSRVTQKGLKRGVPPGKYVFVKTSFDKNFGPDMDLYREIEQRAKGRNMPIDEFVKWLLREMLKSMPA